MILEKIQAMVDDGCTVKFTRFAGFDFVIEVKKGVYTNVKALERDLVNNERIVIYTLDSMLHDLQEYME